MSIHFRPSEVCIINYRRIIFFEITLLLKERGSCNGSIWPLRILVFLFLNYCNYGKILSALIFQNSIRD